MPFDFATIQAPFRMQPGLRRLDTGAAQLTPARLDSHHLREKLAVLTLHAGDALLASPGFDATPALHALARHAAREHPEAFVWNGREVFTAPWLGWSLGDDGSGRADAVEGFAPPTHHGSRSTDIGHCLNALPPAWRLAGLLSLAFEEDFAVIDGASARIPWLAVCLPSHWSPADKIGRHFGEVHAPVADNTLLVKAGEHLARLVTGDDPWERFVWTITRQSALDTHPDRRPVLAWPEEAETGAAFASQAFFRTERQTFIPLPSRRQAVFTIHVEVQPLAQAIASSERAAQVHDALASMSSAVLAYRGLAPARDWLLAWLQSRMASR
ncbi:hypothetical protein BH11PSE8_BH11PSE8_47380 [soil metagenome]